MNQCKCKNPTVTDVITRTFCRICGGEVASEAQPPQAVSASANCSATARAVADNEADSSGHSAPVSDSAALAGVQLERQKQDKKWGIQNHNPSTWLVILGEEVGEACEATLEMDWPRYREEMIQIAAVAVAAIEACDRALGVPPNARPAVVERAMARNVQS